MRVLLVEDSQILLRTVRGALRHAGFAVYFDADLNILYTFVGDPAQHDNMQVALAAEWHLNRRLDILAEVVTTIRRRWWCPRTTRDTLRPRPRH